jgi:hypothetical protein
MVVDVEPGLDCLIGDEAVEYYRSVARTRDSGKCGTSREYVRGMSSDTSATHTSFYLTQTCADENYAPPPASSTVPQTSESNRKGSTSRRVLRITATRLRRTFRVAHECEDASLISTAHVNPTHEVFPRIPTG